MAFNTDRQKRRCFHTPVPAPGSEVSRAVKKTNTNRIWHKNAAIAVSEGVRIRKGFAALWILQSMDHVVGSWCGIGTNIAQNTCGNIVFRFAEGAERPRQFSYQLRAEKRFRKYCLRWRGWLANGASSFQCLSKVAEQQSWAAWWGRVGKGKETSKGTLKAHMSDARARVVCRSCVSITLLFLRARDFIDVG